MTKLLTGALFLSAVLSSGLCHSVEREKSTEDTKPGPKVGIVGAGVGGAISAFFLRRLLGPTAEIFVLAHGPVGGRTQTFTYDDEAWELGASIVFEDNFYMRYLADEMGLKRVPPGNRLKGRQNKRFNIFDGKDYVFQESEWQLVTLLQLFWRYGLTYFRFLAQPRLMFTRFKKIYNIQAGGNGFEHPDDLLKWVDLYDLTQTTMQQHLTDTLGRDLQVLLFADEIVASINRVNYNQNNSLNAMAGMVSMLPTVDSRTFAIQGGNRLLPEALLKNASVVMLSGAAVTEISTDASGLFHVSLAKSAQGPPLLDAVLIACPLEQSGLKLSLPKAPVIPSRSYQVTNTFYVRAGIPTITHPSPPGLIMATGSAPTHFSAISPVKSYEDGTFLYKLFLDGHDDVATLDGIFSNYTIVGQHDWHAYPHFEPPEEFAPFQLAPGLYYGNALETAASAMEIAGIAACNNALLAGNYLSRLGFDLHVGLEQTCRLGPVSGVKAS